MKPRSTPQAALSLFVAFFAVNLWSVAVASDQATQPKVAMSDILEAPKPWYPDVAERHHIHGSGVFLLRTNIQTGRVTEVIVGQTTGNPLLDYEAVKALRRWRFKPGVLVHRDIHKPRLKRPITKDECLAMVPVTF
jgi:TonB family protein